MKKKSIFARYITPVCNLISILDAAEQSPVTYEQVAGEQERIARLLQNGTEAFLSKNGTSSNNWLHTGPRLSRVRDRALRTVRPQNTCQTATHNSCPHRPTMGWKAILFEGSSSLFYPPKKIACKERVACNWCSPVSERGASSWPQTQSGKQISEQSAITCTGQC